jgi:prepilin-type N-terminal cleavage/methylation domain-containing protein
MYFFEQRSYIMPMKVIIMNRRIQGKNKGFTLGELLVVVAIIGVLVAVSVPIFTSQLKKARIATNLANARSAKAAALAEYESSPDMDGKYVMYWYNTTTGKLAPMGYPDTDNSYVLSNDPGLDTKIYDDTFRFGIKFKGISRGDVTNLSEDNKEFLGNQIIDKWGVKIALTDRKINGENYKKGEIMMLVYDVTDNSGGFNPFGRN